jgi:hypothetical protein
MTTMNPSSRGCLLATALAACCLCSLAWAAEDEEEFEPVALPPKLAALLQDVSQEN